jgi:hypothetical protein
LHARGLLRFTEIAPINLGEEARMNERVDDNRQDGQEHVLEALANLLEEGAIERPLFLALLRKLASPCGLCCGEALVETLQLYPSRFPLAYEPVRGRMCESHFRYWHGLARAAHVLDVPDAVKDEVAEQLVEELRALCPLCRQKTRAVLLVHSGGKLDVPDESSWALEEFCGPHRAEFEGAAHEWPWARHIPAPDVSRRALQGEEWPE